MRASRWVELWYRRPALAYLLAPLSLVYGLLCAIRRGLYRRGYLRQLRLSVPVIVIGNISVGGTGKTPLTIRLAAALSDAGFRPGIVCRSYGASAHAPARVSPGDDPHVRGDEAVLLATRLDCPVVSGPDRVAAARALLAEDCTVNVVICDDGLQHYALARDIEVAVIDAARGFGNAMLLPAGPLREPPSRLAAVDAIVVNGEGALAQFSIDQPVFRMRLLGTTFRNLLDSRRTAGAHDFAGRQVVAIAGIGNPQRFFDHLRSLGLVFTAHAFDDHHAYTATELAYLGYDAVLMTEKDAIKCRRFGDARMWALPIDAALAEDFTAMIVDRIARGARPPARISTAQSISDADGR